MFGAIKITKDVNTSHYQYHGYEICFDGQSDFSFGNITDGKNVIIFGADMSFSSHSTNKANNIYVLGKDFVQGINGTTIYAEKIYKHNFTTPNKRLFCQYTTMVIILIYLLTRFWLGAAGLPGILTEQNLVFDVS